MATTDKSEVGVLLSNGHYMLALKVAVGSDGCMRNGEGGGIYQRSLDTYINPEEMGVVKATTGWGEGGALPSYIAS